MSEYALHTVFTNPDQAKAALLGIVGPYCREQWARGVERLSVTIQPEEDDRTLKQNRFYWGPCLKEISEQARIEGQRYADEAWHELFKRQFLGYEISKVSVAGSKRKRVIRRLRSTSDLKVKPMSKYLDEVQAFSATELGVHFTVKDWQSYR